ncbi:Crp/Fnr family transcriptional regulator [Orenia marismortui]|uniref:CRP-like cAMP-binding protein n=1 Tax=Orenia marismortui TaxID=46469 RepID=A0A4R8H0D5_9FIRM|nr:Crp/Fnr family transcriptional regulator [Orenia marismortui]TDX48424.1 CRP-like cAMP-binding protein [Orenia marismortui]
MFRVKEILIELLRAWNLKGETIDSLSEYALIKSYQSGQIIFFDGEEVNKLYIIVNGRVKISKFTEGGKEKMIHILEKGDIINEISLDGRRSSVTAEFIEKGGIISIAIDPLLRIMEEDFNLTLHILNSVNLKLRQSYRQLRNLGLKKTGPRIASRLWKLARDYGKEDREGIEIDLNLSQRELALMIGTSRETVSRFLKELEREEVIIVGNTQITILDIDALHDWT